MPPLIKAAGRLSKDEQNLIGYNEMPAGAQCYIYVPNNENKFVLSHLTVNEDMV
jgi:hypothetical protein